MLRHTMIETIGAEYLTSNIEAGEYSYVQAAGNRTLLESKSVTLLLISSSISVLNLKTL